MKTKICELLGIEVPIFAFSHCRDVVVEVSKAGGMGFLGLARMPADQLEVELQWIDDHIGGKPYGVDVLMPQNYQKLPDVKIGPEDLPQEPVQYLRKLLDDAGIPRLPEDDDQAMLRDGLSRVTQTREEEIALLDIALKHPIKAVVNGLGIPPKEVIDRLHSRGIKIGSLTGKVEHAIKQKNAGIDFIVAVGTEAGGHTGSISSMVLWPEIVDAVTPTPVLAAGGIGSGRQMAAAMALGADGIWCGSIWLGTRESELEPEMKELFWKASSGGTVRTRARSGKPVRMLRSKLTEAWEQPGAPAYLPMPYQSMVWMEPDMRARRAKRKDFMSYPVGEIVGSMHEETTCRQVIYDMMTEFVEAMERVNRLIATD